jgi:cytosine/uracil/thiamine/allantoin permease
MNNTNQKQYYSPQFLRTASIAIRRLAWALGGNMVQAANELVSFLPQLVDTSKVCLFCKDNTKCTACIFSDTVPTSALSNLTN